MTIDAPSRVAITGAGGFVGRCVLSHLTRAGHSVKALAHRRDVPGAQTVRGGLFDDAALDELLKNCDAVVHLVGIIREFPRKGQTFDRIHHEATARLVARAAAHGVRRFVHMSALGTRENARSEYHRSKWRGEQAVRDSALTWTILRPSLIVGPDGEFAQLMRDFWVKRLPPMVPYFGKGILGFRGSGRVQPVGVEDVARCFVAALSCERAAGRVYEIGGPEAMDWPTMYRRVKAVIDGARGKPIVAIPSWLAKCVASLPLPGLPFNRAQVIMAEEDSVCDTAAARDDLGFEPRSLEEAMGGMHE